MRAITRVTGVSLNTVTKLLIDAGNGLLANDSDVDGDALTVNSVQNAQNGSGEDHEILVCPRGEW